MGNWLSSWFWSPPPAPPPIVDPDTLRATALAELRESHHILEARAADKRRRVAEADVRLVELGLRMRARGNRLSEADAHTFRRVSRHRRHLLKSHSEFESMIGNLDVQIESLADAPALEHSLSRLADSVDVRARRVAETRALLDSVRADMEALVAGSSRSSSQLADATAHVDADVLSRELESLMASDELAAARQRVERQLAAAPSPPTDDPEATLGLAVAMKA